MATPKMAPRAIPAFAPALSEDDDELEVDVVWEVAADGAVTTEVGLLDKATVAAELSGAVDLGNEVVGIGEPLP